jgi:hypothetical protein
VTLGVAEFLSLGSRYGRTLTMPMAIVHGAFDESGKFHDHDVTSLCGWVASYDAWERFALRWQAALDEIGIDELHAAEFMGLYGKYVHLRTIWGAEQEAKKDNALTLLCNVLRGTMGKGVGATIDSKRYRSMDDGFKKAIHKSKDPHFIAFIEVLEQTIWNVEKFAKEHGLGLNVKAGLIFDQDERQSVECLRLLNQAKKQREDIRDRISGICFCDRRNYQPLQAADFIAYLTKKEMERRKGRPEEPVSKWFAMLSSQNRANIPDGLFNARIFDAEVLDELAEKVKKRKP